MAGRGCTITVKVIGSCGSSDGVEDIRLPVALHSPLEVLRQQLEDLVGISLRDQVLILLDLSDPERNHDVLLVGRDHQSLRACGIRNNSVLSLHALGLSAETRQKMIRAALLKAGSHKNDSQLEEITSLSTYTEARQADHSFNGIIFDVMCKSPYEVEIASISIAGMLGRVRIFARDRPWEADKPPRPAANHWWAHTDAVSTVGWTMVADVTCRPSWDLPFEISFTQPVKMLPNSVRGFYCHSSLPDDLGIQYQSCRVDDIIAEDEILSIHPGLGHTGSNPFDEVHGWYRSYRSLAGSIQYRARRKGWQVTHHNKFPKVMKDSILETIKCHHHMNPYHANFAQRLGFGHLPRFVVFHIFEYMVSSDVPSRLVSSFD